MKQNVQNIAREIKLNSLLERKPSCDETKSTSCCEKYMILFSIPYAYMGTS